MDQIADLLTRIKNITAVNKTQLLVSYSKITEAILNIFVSEGFIRSFEREDDGVKKFFKVTLSSKKSITHLKQISKPGLRVYAKSKEIPKPLHGLGVVIISTSAGITTGKEAKKTGLGGELICEIW